MAEAKEENPNLLNEFFYTWRIENALLCWQKTGEKLTSPPFEIEWVPKSSFELCLYPKGIEGNEDYISYFLTIEEHISATVNKLFRSELYLLAADGSKVENDGGGGFLSHRKSGLLGWQHFMKRKTLMDKKSNYLPDEILTLCCRIWNEVKPDTKGKISTEIKACVGRGFARTQIKKQVIAKLMAINEVGPGRQKIGEIKSILPDYLTATFSASFGKISDRVSLTINIDAKKDDIIKLAIFKLMLIDEKRKRIFWMNSYPWYDTTKLEDIVISPHFPKNSEQYTPDEIFEEKLLFLACELIFTTGFVVEMREKDNYGTNLNHLLPQQFYSDVLTMSGPTLKDALIYMRDDFDSHDIIIRTSEEDATVHQMVLFTRAPGFKHLQTTRDEESSISVVSVSEDRDTMDKVIYFLYTNTILDIDWQVATSLYKTAVKYEINELKRKCSDFINSNLEKSKIAEILLLAKEHKDTELLALAKKFVMENETAVYSTNEWESFRKSHADFAVEIMMSKFQSK